MKPWLLAVALAVPMFGQPLNVFTTTQVSGDVTINGGQYVLRVPGFPQLDHSTAWAQVSTTDLECDLYRMTVKYSSPLMPGREFSEVKYVPSVRLSAYGDIGSDKNQQAPVRITVQLSTDARVSSITVEKLKILGSATIQPD